MEYTMRKTITIDDLLKARTLLERNRPKSVIVKGSNLNKLYRTSRFKDNIYYIGYDYKSFKPVKKTI